MKYIEHTIIEYLCDKCDKPLGNHIGNPYYVDEQKNICLCGDCALDSGLIDAMEWLHNYNIGLGIFEKAEYENGVVTAYQKWGRGYTKHLIPVYDNTDNKAVQNE